MKQHRGRANRGTWTRKANVVEAAETPSSLKTSSKRVKDDSCTWTDTAAVDDSGSCWDAQTFDASFFEDNKKIFEWDDSGALDTLKKAERHLLLGMTLAWEDYLREVENFSASADFDTRWSCTLPDCADAGEDVLNREERKKNPKASFMRKDHFDSTSADHFDNTSAVILGLPEMKDGAGHSATPSLHLPLNFVPLPTGWDEGEDTPAEAPREDSPMQPAAVTNLEETQLEPSALCWWQPPTNANEVWAAGTGRPEYPDSYQHIIPSGWGDVQTDPPVVPPSWGNDQADPPIVPSGWGDFTEDPQLDTQMHQADTEWGKYPSHEPGSSSREWGDLQPSTEMRDVYDNSYGNRNQQHIYNNSYKNGYWKPKRGSDTHDYESSGRRTIQRPGRHISTMYRVNHDPRPRRLNHWQRSNSQWQSAGTLTHD